MRRLSNLCAATFLASIVAAAAPDSPPQKSPSPAPLHSAPTTAAAPIDGKTLTKAKLLALPDGAVVLIKGKTFTAGELRALAARSAAKRRPTDALRAKAKSDAAAAQAAFRAQETSRVSRANALLTARFAGAHRTVAKLDPGMAAAMAAPQITSISGNAEPGAALYIQGKSFSEDIGTVLLKGLPGGDRVLGLDPSYLFPWVPTAIAVVVPDITNVVDQTVSIVVVRKGGMSSAPTTIPFTAARDVMSAYPNRVVTCGQDATDNACLAFDFFEGVHIEDTFWEVDAVDCDRFVATAKPPWAFERFMISNESDGGQIGNPVAVRSGDSYNWQVCWTVNGAGPYSGNQAKYVGFLMIKGPKGVPSS